jgi:hypothetical protein
MTTIAAPETFSFGRVISRLFGVLQRNLVTFLLLSVLLVGLPAAVIGFVQYSAVAPMFSGGSATVAASVLRDAFSPLKILFGFVALLVSIVGNAVLQGGVIHASVSDLSGSRASFGECLATGLRFFLPLFCIGLIVGICCSFAALIFIVPGVLLALAWCVAAPVEVVERVGVFAALGRSVVLTRNRRGAILGLVVIYAVALWIVQTTLSGTMMVSVGLSASGFGARPGQGFQNLMLLQMIVQLLLNTLFASIGSAGIASIYFELRQTKEGVGAEQLAAVFD